MSKNPWVSQLDYARLSGNLYEVQPRTPSEKDQKSAARTRGGSIRSREDLKSGPDLADRIQDTVTALQKRYAIPRETKPTKSPEDDKKSKSKERSEERDAPSQQLLADFLRASQRASHGDPEQVVESKRLVDVLVGRGMDENLLHRIRKSFIEGHGPELNDMVVAEREAARLDS